MRFSIATDVAHLQKQIQQDCYEYKLLFVLSFPWCKGKKNDYPISKIDGFIFTFFTEIISPSIAALMPIDLL